MHVAGPTHIAAQAHTPARPAPHAPQTHKPKEQFEALHFQKVASEAAAHAKAAHKAEAEPKPQPGAKPDAGADAATQSRTAHSQPQAKRLGSLIDIRA